jgi:hypothetical protein
MLQPAWSASVMPGEPLYTKITLHLRALESPGVTELEPSDCLMLYRCSLFKTNTFRYEHAHKIKIKYHQWKVTISGLISWDYHLNDNSCWTTGVLSLGIGARDGALTICPPTLCPRYNSTCMVHPSNILSQATIHYCYTLSPKWYIQGFKIHLGKKWTFCCMC